MLMRSQENRSQGTANEMSPPDIHDEILKVAQTKGSGWVDYWLPKPGQTEPSQKWSYIKAVKAEGVAVVGAGFFPSDASHVRCPLRVKSGHWFIWGMSAKVFQLNGDQQHEQRKHQK